ncbi:acyl-CoA thioesterase [Pseudonocardia sp. GCM10023141]|uniref:acyl-CoA thioesterase n=1 Tax=Pseudonocardia sp. GCM10023141 TaxID=3252653 RepID=UPI00360CCC2C
MSRYVTQVPLRWSDQDANRHVNNARVVTLLEEARVGLLYEARTTDKIGGLFVAGLNVDYRRQLPYRPEPLHATLWVAELRAASYKIHYELHVGPKEDDPVAVEAWTKMAMFDFDTQRPRRFTPDELAFLRTWVDE